MAKILRHPLPVDDQPHRIDCGRVVHVNCKHAVDVVEVWALDSNAYARHFIVIGTGRDTPFGYQYVGTALTRPNGDLVWHVFEENPDGHG